MDIKNISLPEIYKESSDFRFFCKWFETSLERIKYDTENFFDLYDPLRCPESLLWLLADTMGYKFDDRENLPTAFNRLVLLYFMSMIYNRGSKDGVTLAAEVNLTQFSICQKAYGYTDIDGKRIEGNPILENRLEDTSIPVNSVYVTSHAPKGYIDVVYFSKEVPQDACIEYVRPLGMFLFQQAGVRFDARTKISVDARLTDSRDLGLSATFGPTQVGHYRREDYARLQKTAEVASGIEGNPRSFNGKLNNTSHKRNPVWYRNSDFEDMEYGDGSYESGVGKCSDPAPNAGYRAIYSLQLSNNEEIVSSLIGPIFSLGYEPQVEVVQGNTYLKNPTVMKERNWNLIYDRELDEKQTSVNSKGEYDISVVNAERTQDAPITVPTVNPIMMVLGDAISMNNENTTYTKYDPNTDSIIIKDISQDSSE